ncbi:Carotenoid 910(9'10')-cleavage dioxygenase 1, partial [Dissostichus eleginoides]
ISTSAALPHDTFSLLMPSIQLTQSAFTSPREVFYHWPLKLLLGDISPPKNPPGGQLTCTGHRTDALTGETSPV